MSNNKFFFKLWGPVICLLLIPIIILNLNINNLKQKLTREAIDDMLAETEFSARKIDELFERIWFNTERITVNPNVQQMILNDKQEDSVNFIQTTKNVQSVIYSLLKSNDFEISMYLNKNRLLISGGKIYYNLDSIYGSIYQFQTLTVHDFKNICASQDYGKTFYAATPSKSDGTTITGIAYSHPFSLITDESNGGYIFVVIKESALLKVMPPSSTADSFTALYDQAGNTLFKTGTLPDNSIPMSSELESKSGFINESKLNNKHIGAYSITQEGLSIVSIRPKADVFSSVSTLLNITVTLNIAMLLFLLIMLILTIKYWKNKFAVIVNSLSSSDTNNANSDLFTFLNTNISYLLTNTSRLEKAYLNQQIYIKDIFWDRILNNNQPETFNNLASKAGISDLNMYFSLVLFKINARENRYDAAAIDDILKNRKDIIDLIDTDFNFCLIGVEQIALLMPIANTDYYQAEIRDHLFSILPNASNSIQIDLACSQPFNDFTEFYSLYQDCRVTLNGSTRNDAKILWCNNETPESNDTIKLSHETEITLENSVKVGNYKAVRKLLGQIIQDNFIYRSCSPEMYDLLTAKLKIILMNLYTKDMKYSFDEYISRINNKKTESSTYSELMKLFYEYSEYYLEKHQKKDEALRKEIVDFIDSNYKNSDFSLTIIADYFNFNESYFSRLFKDVMGENFINYLERKRLLDADNLLLNSECTIEEISIDCGYTNSDTFRRAYRRYFAISPTQRRTTKV